MKKLKLILKGFLFYLTMTLILILITGIDSIFTEKLFLHFIIVISILLYLCTRILTNRDIYILSGQILINKIFKKTNNK